MGKYVDLSQTVTASYYDEKHEEWRFKQRTIEDLLDDICDSYSTVDAIPVVYGRWKRAYLDHVAMGERPSIFYCSVCNQCIAYPVNYCPSCGARMDGKDGDGNEDELHFCFSCGADMRGKQE